MPHIDAVMRRSLRRSVGEILVDNILRRQSITDNVNNVKTTFSSWDNCMAKTYCKWPVIGAMIVGGLIVFSVLWCVIRCCCCGMSCCCSCFSFLKCCDCCGGLCDGKKNKPMKHLDDPYAHHAASSGFRPSPSMPAMGGGFGGKPEPPQYAQFEVGKNGLAVEPKPLSEDALPPMPSWENATKKHVEEKTESVELGDLDPKTGQKVPLMAGGAAPGTSMPPSPVTYETNNSTPFGARDGQGGPSGYAGVAAGDPYAQNQNNFNGNGYGPQSNGVASGHVSPPPQDMYGPNTNFIGAALPGYNQRPPRQNTGDHGYNNMGNRQYPPQQQRQYSGNSSRPLDRQYSDRTNNYDSQGLPGPSRGPGRVASPPNNNSGFNFNENNNQPYSRPDYQSQPSYNSNRRQSPPSNNDYYNGSNGAPSYGSRSPPPQEPQYSGYDSYQPSQSSNHRRDPTALRPGGGRDRRQPQGWDPVNNNY